MPASSSEKPSEYSKPIPTKFLVKDDFAVLEEATKDTRLSRSEIVRCAVRLLGRQAKTLGSYRFVMDLGPST